MKKKLKYTKKALRMTSNIATKKNSKMNSLLIKNCKQINTETIKTN